MLRWLCPCGIMAVALGLASLTGRPARSADHLEAPIVAQDLGSDISDVLVFGQNKHVVMVMATNRMTPAGARMFFDPNVLYQFKIDNNGDLVEDLVIQATFSRAGGTHVNQQMTLRGPAVPSSRGASNKLLSSRLPAASVVVRTADGVDTSTFVPTSLAGTIKQAWAGIIDDPFFYDEVWAERQFSIAPGGPLMRGPGRDFHSSFNVSAIAVGMPAEALLGRGVPPLGGGPADPNRINVWCTTSRARRVSRSLDSSDVANKAPFIQIDRAGKPGINDFLIGLTNTASGAVANPAAKLERKNLFNRITPSQDGSLFADEVRTELINRYGNSTAEAEALLPFLLPDVLNLNTASTAGFPNGRRPGDDAVDALLRLITGNPSFSDGVNANDQALESVFPFLGLQHTPDEDPAPRG